MKLDLLDVNFLAVFVASIVGYAFNMIWYGPLFGKTWLKFSKWDPEELKKVPPKLMQIKFAIGYLQQIVLSYFLAVFLTAFKAETFAHILGFSFLLWLAFVAVIAFNSVLWENHSVPFYTINVSARLANFWVLSTIYFVVKNFAQ